MSPPVAIEVPARFRSRKTNVDWKAAGMQRGSIREWLEALHQHALPRLADLRSLLLSKMRLRCSVTIYGDAQWVEPLDIHDALSQVIDELVDLALPREPGKPEPQWRDSAFWNVVGTKQISADPRVVIRVEEIARRG